MWTAEQELNRMYGERIKQRFEILGPLLNEKERRWLAGVEAIAYGRGGITNVARLTGLSPITVRAGLRELNDPSRIERKRVRADGGGRKPKLDSDPTLESDLERIVAPTTRGDPVAPLKWTCKSTRNLASELNALQPGRAVSDHLVRTLLRRMGYSLQANRKVREGASHADRDAQFAHINATVQFYQDHGQPVISVDAKKKERAP
jgi:hypothetical protein